MRKGIGGHHRAYKGLSDSWITPPEIPAALGSFDLDPCISTPQPFHFAAQEYTESQDGLALPWTGRVWLNPPYGPATAIWLRRLAEHNNGIAIAFARTETRMFFESVWEKAAALLFIKERLHFYSPEGKRAPHNAGAPSVLIAYGQENIESLVNSKIKGARLVHWRTV